MKKYSVFPGWGTAVYIVVISLLVGVVFYATVMALGGYNELYTVRTTAMIITFVFGAGITVTLMGVHYFLVTNEKIQKRARNAFLKQLNGSFSNQAGVVITDAREKDQIHDNQVQYLFDELESLVAHAISAGMTPEETVTVINTKFTQVEGAKYGHCVYPTLIEMDIMSGDDAVALKIKDLYQKRKKQD